MAWVVCIDSGSILELFCAKNCFKRDFFLPSIIIVVIIINNYYFVFYFATNLICYKRKPKTNIETNKGREPIVCSKIDLSLHFIKESCQ